MALAACLALSCSDGTTIFVVSNRTDQPIEVEYSDGEPCRSGLLPAVASTATLDWWAPVVRWRPLDPNDFHFDGTGCTFRATVASGTALRVFPQFTALIEYGGLGAPSHLVVRSPYGDLELAGRRPLIDGFERRTDSLYELAYRVSTVETTGVNRLASTSTPSRVPCSGYPLDGETGPFRLAGQKEIDPPKRLGFRAPDVGSLRLSMSDVAGPLILETIVSAEGIIESVTVFRSAHPEFDRLAITALEASDFRAAHRRGEPVTVCVTYTVWPHE